MVSSLLVLHEGYGISHRDFSLENLLIKNDTIKLADFGVAALVPSEPKLQW